MNLVVCDPQDAARLIAERRALGLDRFDEVWDGVYVMPPMPNDEHQQIVARLTAIFQDLIGWPGLGEVRPGVNVSDRLEDWTHNFRCPDVAVFLRGNPARNCGSHWVGGPDFGVEILSAGDRAREKFDFYASVGVRELLLIDRDPWALELYALKRKKLRPIGRTTLGETEPLASSVLPITFRLTKGPRRPIVRVSDPEGK